MAQNLIQAGAPITFHTVDVGAAINQGASLRRQRLENQLLEGTIEGKQIAGQSIQAATDLDPDSPSYGSVDYDKANALVQGNPDASYAAQDFATHAIQQHQAQTDLASKKAELHNYVNSKIDSRLLSNQPTADNPDGFTLDHVSDAMGDAVRDGYMTPHEFAAGITKLSSMTQPGQKRAYIESMYKSTLPPEAQQQQTIGVPGSMDTGNQITGVRMGPNGPVATGNNLTLGVSPASMLPHASVRTPSGEISGVPLPGQQPGNFVPAPGGNSLTGPANSLGTGPNGNALLPSDLPANDPHSVQALAGMLGGALPPQSAPVQAGSPAANLTPTTSAHQHAAEQAAGGSAQQLTTDLAQASRIRDTLYPLQESVSLLNDVKTGTGATALNKVAGALAAIEGPGSKAYEYATSANKLGKYLTQGVASAAAQFGSGTDKDLAAAFSGSPNMSLTNMANGDVLKATIALRRASAAIPLIAQGQGVAPEDYQRFAANIAPQIDPRAFGADYLTQAQIKAIPGYNPDPSKATGEFAKFAHSYSLAKQAGLVTGIGTNLPKGK